MNIRIISSMATKQLLADLAVACRQQADVGVTVESVGGVDAAKRVRSGEAFDVVVLASSAIDALIAEGHVVAGSRTDLVRSGVSVAIPKGAPRPALDDEAAVQRALIAAQGIGYSTGPSGVALLARFEAWGLMAQLKDRLVQAPPGVPVAALVARRQVDIGFQQLSELLNVDGIDIVGPLPASIQIVTIFSAGIASTSRRPDAVRAMLASMIGASLATIAASNGMEAA